MPITLRAGFAMYQKYITTSRGLHPAPQMIANEHTFAGTFQCIQKVTSLGLEAGHHTPSIDPYDMTLDS